MSTEYRFVGSHPDELDGGRPVEPGEFIGAIEIDDDPDSETYTPKNAQLRDDGHLLEVEDGSAKAAAKAAATEEPPQPDEDGLLRGDDLNRRADELGIKGRSKMSADELRASVAEAEAAEASNDDQGV